MKLLTANQFARLAGQRLVTVSEVVNSLYGLNPNTRVRDIPPELAEEAQDIKKTISRNLRTLNFKFGSGDEIDADYVFAAAYIFTLDGTTPEEIKERTIEAIESFVYSNQWQEFMYAFGGRSLVDDISAIRKTGRGKHRKEDEEAGTLKMLGFIIKLLAQKTSGNKYGTIDKPVITEIYRDVCALAESEELSLKGVGKSTFADKAKRALLASKN